MNTLTGFIKGTPVSTGNGYIRIETSADARLPVKVVYPDNTTSLVRPVGVRWYWTPVFYTLSSENGYLRLPENQEIYSQGDWLPVKAIKPRMFIAGLGQLLSVKQDRVLAPMCRLLFTKPTVILCKGTYLYLPLENETQGFDNDYCQEAEDYGTFRS